MIGDKHGLEDLFAVFYRIMPDEFVNPYTFVKEKDYTYIVQGQVYMLKNILLEKYELANFKHVH